MLCVLVLEVHKVIALDIGCGKFMQEYVQTKALCMVSDKVQMVCHK
jgi:hypothetical protein